MKNKKKILIITMLGLIIITIAIIAMVIINNNKSTNNRDNTNSNAIGNTNTSDTIESSGYEMDYKLGYDFPLANSGQITESEEGYYILMPQNIAFYDKATGKVSMLCGKPECEHNDETCSSYASPFTTSILCLQYMNGRLYYIEYEENAEEGYKTISLMSMSKTGEDRKKVVALYNVSLDDNIGFPQIYFHRNYVYYAPVKCCIDEEGYSYTEEKKLYRVDLEGKEEPVCIFSREGYQSEICSVEFKDDNMFFVSRYRTDRDSDPIGSIKKMNVDDLAITDLSEEELGISDLMVREDSIWYRKLGDGIYKLNNDGTTSVVYKFKDESEHYLGMIKVGDYAIIKNTDSADSGFIEDKEVTDRIINDNGEIIKTIPIGEYEKDTQLIMMYGYTPDYVFEVEFNLNNQCYNVYKRNLFGDNNDLEKMCTVKMNTKNVVE